ncbi:LuxR C-terminal-related transcriptional regulator [Devosia sp.]|uniref:LuxR C-terminal-related transcriptional regulator n=1 Tax=Devosia sp. TaxID=1871048 RepID=UPI0032655CBB
MLALLEGFLGRIRQARTDSEIIDLLGGIAASFGFRSGYLIEYVSELKSALHVLDSDSSRGDWWSHYVAAGLRTNTASIEALLEKGGVQRFGGERFTAPNDPLLEFARKNDMVECVMVPISHDGKIVGLAAFSGDAPLNRERETALQLLAYSLFAQTRSLRGAGIKIAPERLTPRERQVMQLSAEGLTSQEIAVALGMSPRTVNQHVDNVGNKLGTKNRVHTVAEVIRHDMLH